FGSRGPNLLASTLHRPWSIGVNLSLNLHHAPSTAISHPSPAHHKPRATSYATVLSITHHTKGANLPWFLNLPLDECIDQHTPQILTKKKRLNFNQVTSRKRLGPLKIEANSTTQPRRKGRKRKARTQSTAKGQTPPEYK